MSRPTIFISAVSSELGTLRNILHKAFEQHFRVITQDITLSQNSGRGVKELLVDAIAQSDSVIHLTGQGFGSTATAAFPEQFKFDCSWTQFEYYHAHSIRKPVYALACSPSLSDISFKEQPDSLSISDKKNLQQSHAARVASGKFDNTPFPQLHRTVNNRHEHKNREEILRSAVRLCGELSSRDPAYDRVKETLQQNLESLQRIEKSQSRTFRNTIIILALIICGLFLTKKGHEESKKRDNDTSDSIEATLYDPLVLKARIEKEIRAKADTLIAQKKAEQSGWKEIAEIERQRDSQLSQLGSLIDSIGENLTPDSDPIYKNAIYILEKEGIDETLQYLDQKMSGLFEDANLIDSELEVNQNAYISKIQPVLLQADLLQTQFKFDEALSILIKASARNSKSWSICWQGRNQLGNLHQTLANWEESETELSAAIALAQTVTQKSTSLNNLGTTFLHTSRYRQAEEKFQIAIAEEEQTGIYINLGKLYQDTGRFKEALDVCDEALKLIEKGPVYKLEVIGLINNLGEIHREMGEVGEAAKYYNIAIEKFGDSEDKEIQTILSMIKMNLALTMFESDPQSGKSIILDVLQIFKNERGDDHPYVGVAIDNLGSFTEKEGDLEGGRELYFQALEILGNSYGESHLDYAICLGNIANNFHFSGETKQAIPYYEKALNIVKIHYPEKSELLATRYSQLSTAFITVERYDDALPSTMKSLEIRKEQGDARSPELAVSLNNYGIILSETGRPAEAIVKHLRSLEIRESHYGEFHSQVNQSLANLARAYIRNGEIDNALVAQRRSLEIFEKTLPLNRSDTVGSMTSLARALVTTNTKDNLSEAETLFERAVSILESTADGDPVRLSRIYLLYGDVLKKNLDFDKAELVFRKALSIREAVCTEDSEEVKNAVVALALFANEHGDQEEAISLFIRCLRINEKLIGIGNPNNAPMVLPLVILLGERKEFKHSVGVIEKYFRAALEFERENDREHINLPMYFSLYFDVSADLGVEGSEIVENLRLIALDMKLDEDGFLQRISTFPTRGDFLYQRAFEFYKEENFSEAMKTWRKSKSIYSKSKIYFKDEVRRTTLNIAACAVSLDDPSAARDTLSALVRELNEAQVKDSFAARVRFHLARAYLHRKIDDTSSARITIEEALEIYNALPLNQVIATHVDECRHLLRSLSH